MTLIELQPFSNLLTPNWVHLFSHWWLIFLATLNIAHLNQGKDNQHGNPGTAFSLLLQTLCILNYEDDMASLSYLHNYKNRIIANVLEKTSFLSNNEFILHLPDTDLGVEPVCARCFPACLKEGKNKSRFLFSSPSPNIVALDSHREGPEVSRMGGTTNLHPSAVLQFTHAIQFPYNIFFEEKAWFLKKSKIWKPH